jgi:hypothetical protein
MPESLNTRLITELFLTFLFRICSSESRSYYLIGIDVESDMVLPLIFFAV